MLKHNPYDHEFYLNNIEHTTILSSIDNDYKCNKHSNY